MTTAVPLCERRNSTRAGQSTSPQHRAEFRVITSAAAEVLSNGGSRGYLNTADHAHINSWRRRLSASKPIADAERNANEAISCADGEVLQALATASAFVAAADGCDKVVSRDEFVRFVGGQGFVSEPWRCALGEAFDGALRRLEADGDAPAIVRETLRPLAGLSLASVVVRTAERVAGADGRMRQNRLQALVALRSILFELADKRNAHRDGGARSEQTLLQEVRGPRSPRPVP